MMFERFYNSDPLVSRGIAPGSFGSHWTHTFSRQVDIPRSNRAVVQRSDGQAYLFLDPVGDVWQGPSDIGGTLTGNGSTGYVYHAPDGSTENYDADGALTSIENNQGFRINIYYEAVSGLTIDRIDYVTDNFGRTVLDFHYDAPETFIITKVTDADGAEIEYEYGAYLEKVIYPDEDDATGGGRANNPFREYRYAEAAHTTDPTDTPFVLTGIIDENNDRFATWKYDSEGRAYHSEHAGGADLTTLEFLSNTSTKVTDPLGHLETETYEIINGDVKLADSGNEPCSSCGARSKTVAYDANGYPEEKTDFNGNKSLMEYDDLGQELCRIEGIAPAGGTDALKRVVTEWDSDYRVMTERRVYEKDGLPNLTACDDADNAGWTIRKKITNVYESASGRLSTSTMRSYDSSGTEDETARTTSYTYYGSSSINGMEHQLKTIDGPRTDVADVTTFKYATSAGSNHAIGDLISTTNAKGHVTTINKHDGYSRPTEIQDPNGMITTLTYHPRGWLLSRVVDGQTTTFTYDDAGNLDVVTLPNGSFLDYDYDDAHRLTDITDNLGNTIHYVLDAMGNRTREETKDNGGTLHRQVDRVYNTLNELTSMTAGAGQVTTLTYDDNQNVVDTVDPRDPAPSSPSIYSENEYDARDRVISTTNHTTDSSGGTTQFEYDVFDNVTKVTDPLGLITTYTYNGFSDLKTLVSPDTGTTTYSYDEAGNRTQQINARPVTTNYDYDELNRLTTIDYPNDIDTVHTYDENGAGQNGIGRLTTTIDEVGTTTRLYDLRGNVIEKELLADGVTMTNTYTYNGTDQLMTLTYPSGLFVEYTRNALGQITKVKSTEGGTTTALVDVVTYKPFGPVTGWTFGNGKTMTRDYDLDYRITDLIHTGLLDRDYSYDPANNITGWTDNAGYVRWGSPFDRSQSFQYDDMSRVTQADVTAQSLVTDYTYDLNGNRTWEDNPRDEILTTIAPGTNQIDQRQFVSSTMNFYFDSAGNMTGAGGTSITYGEDNRIEDHGPYLQLAHHHSGQVGTVDQSYSAKGAFIYDEPGKYLSRVLLEPLWGGYMNAGDTQEDYIFIDDIPIAYYTYWPSSSSLLYIHTDHLGLPHHTTTTVGNEEGGWFFSPFGRREWLNQASTPTVFFPGQLQPNNSTIVYNHFREYDVETGKYYQSDPIGLRGGYNTYSYVDSNPLKYIDPLGLRARVCCRPLTDGSPFDHCFIQRETDGESKTWGLFGNWRGAGATVATYGRISENDGFDDPNFSKCGSWNESCKVDACVEREANRYHNPSVYNLARGPNSNTFAGNIARSCGLSKHPSSGSTPGWDDHRASKYEKSEPTLPGFAPR